MTKRRGGTIPDEAWGRHKGEIVSLYQSSTRERVMQLMGQRHGFHASKSQYTRMFKKWGIRTYSNARDWKKIDRCIRKRQSEGKASNVVLYGNPISQYKLEKEIARYVSFTDRIFSAKDNDDVSIPDGVTILTPPATMVFPPRNRVIRTDNLPWHLFDRDVRSQIILRKTLSDSTRFMAGRHSDTLAHPVHYPRLESLETSHAQQGLVPSSIYSTTSGLDSMALNIESMFDPISDIGSSWVNTSSNSILIDPEVRSATLTVLLQKATAEYPDITSVEDALPSKVQNQTALQCAVAMDWMEGVRLLLDYKPDVRMLPFFYEENSKAYSALGWAIKNSNHDMIALLLDHGASPNDPISNSPNDPPTALLYALSRLNSSESIELFVKKGADINQCWGSQSALEVAIRAFPVNIEVVRMMIGLISQTTGNHCDDRIEKSLPWVDWKVTENLELIQLLLDAGADINAKDPDDETTILQNSVIYGSFELVEFLLRNGAEVNIPATRRRGTPLQEAIKHQGTKTVDLLLEHGADVNAPPAEEGGVTALKAAAIHGYNSLALKLLERGADVAAAPSPIDGRTAIDGAAEQGLLDMLQLLLNAYGDREGLASVCSQAESLAEKKGHVDIAVWLRAYAAS